MRRCRAAAFLLATLSVAGPRAPSPEEARRLAAGEVLVELLETPGGGAKEGVGTGVIDAPPERVFAALTDFAHYQEWVPFVARSDARPQADGSVISAQALHLPAFVGDRSYRIRAQVEVPAGPRAKLWRTWWTYVPGSGNVVDTHGSWTLAAFGAGRTLATCHLYTDPGSVPRWVLNRATARGLPWIFGGLRQQVLRGRYFRH